MQEVSLTNNQDKASLLRKRAVRGGHSSSRTAGTPPPHPVTIFLIWQVNAGWATEGSRARPHAWRVASSGLDSEGAVSGAVTLGPLEIKTFVVTHGNYN